MAIIAYIVICAAGMVASLAGAPLVIVPIVLAGMAVIAFRRQLRHHSSKVRLSTNEPQTHHFSHLPLSRPSALNPQGAAAPLDRGVAEARMDYEEA